MTLSIIGKRRYSIKLWKIFSDVFNCLPVAALIDDKIFCMHGGLSPELSSPHQISRVMRPTEVPDEGIFGVIVRENIEFLWIGLLCDLLWSDPDVNTKGWGDNDRGVSFTFGPQTVAEFLQKHDLDLICRAHQVFSWEWKSE